MTAMQRFALHGDFPRSGGGATVSGSSPGLGPRVARGRPRRPASLPAKPSVMRGN